MTARSRLSREAGGERLALVADDLVPESQDLQLASLALLYQRLIRDQFAVVDFVAVALAGALPGAVKVKRRGWIGRGPVETVEVNVGDRRYELRVRNGAIEASQCELVGGVALKHEPLSLPDWVGGLLRTLDRWAVQSDAARAALQQLS